MTADTSRDLLAWLETAISEREKAVRRLVGVGGCPDWGHCRPDCTHENRDAQVQQDVTDRLRRCAADRKLLRLHGGNMHSCPATDDTDYLDEWTHFGYDDTCPVVQLLAESYGWTESEKRSCGDAKRHPSHTFMRMDVLFQCPGAEGEV